MHHRKVIVGTATVFVVGALLLVSGFMDQPAAAASVPKVLIMRCTALGAPTYSYQVSALSHTPQLPLNIEASTVEGEGQDCALAISQIVAAPIDISKIKLQATDDAVIVTVLY